MEFYQLLIEQIFSEPIRRAKSRYYKALFKQKNLISELEPILFGMIKDSREGEEVIDEYGDLDWRWQAEPDYIFNAQDELEFSFYFGFAREEYSHKTAVATIRIKKDLTLTLDVAI